MTYDIYNTKPPKQDLPFRVSDIKRALMLIRTSNNAHGWVNCEILSEKVDGLPDEGKRELAQMLRNIADGLLTSKDAIQDLFSPPTGGSGQPTPSSLNSVGDNHELLMRLQAVQHGTDRPYAASVAKDAGDAIKAMDAEIKRLLRVATDRQYMMDAYKAMLGPIALQVVKQWNDKGVIRQHTDWGPDAYALSGEERAQTLLDVEAALRREETIVQSADDQRPDDAEHNAGPAQGDNNEH